MKVNELAKELCVTSKTLITRLKSLKVSVEGPDSVLDRAAVAMAKAAIAAAKSSQAKEKKTAKAGHKPGDKIKEQKPKAVKEQKPKAVKVKKAVKKAAPKLKAVEPAKASRDTAGVKEKHAMAVAPAPVLEPEKKTQAPQPAAAPPVAAAVPPVSVEKVKPEEKETPVSAPVEEEGVILELNLPITVKDLSVKLQEKPSILIKRIMDKGRMVGINQSLEEDLVRDICRGYGFRIKKAKGEEETALFFHQEKDPPHLLSPRAPVVTLMGHVDHGKTSLLDALRQSNVAQRESGGITQHIGAYRLILPKGSITFLDTPGHEAFTAMRARGARITDIVVLVVAGDDGIMPQTVEAVDHAREAGVPIIVAINKIDKPQANIDKVKKQLAELNLKAEDWQGNTITVPVSAKSRQGIDGLLEMILLEAEMLELKAGCKRPAMGVVIESRMKKGQGYVSTLLVQNGTLRLNDNFIVGDFYGKIKAMFDDCGRPLSEAGPSMPVEVLGIAGAPEGGEQFFVVEDEKKARSIALSRQEKEKLAQMKTIKRISLDDLYAEIKEGKVEELKLILKADVAGSLEAIRESFKKLDSAEVKLNIIHQGTGPINVSDVILASASNALILGFHVVADERAQELIKKEGIEVRTYNIIYELSNDLKSALEGMLEPEIKKIFLGRAEVKKVFQLSTFGTIAGCSVVKGRIPRNAEATLVRNGEIIFKGKISSLKRFKDDAREVTEGFECGISLAGLEDLKAGDIIEAYDIEKIARKL
jgi:translation initiation factor IF-2